MILHNTHDIILRNTGNKQTTVKKRNPSPFPPMTHKEIQERLSENPSIRKRYRKYLQGCKNNIRLKNMYRIRRENNATG